MSNTKEFIPNLYVVPRGKDSKNNKKLKPFSAIGIRWNNNYNQYGIYGGGKLIIGNIKDE